MIDPTAYVSAVREGARDIAGRVLLFVLAFVVSVSFGLAAGTARAEESLKLESGEEVKVISRMACPEAAARSIAAQFPANVNIDLSPFFQLGICLSAPGPVVSPVLEIVTPLIEDSEGDLFVIVRIEIVIDGVPSEVPWFTFAWLGHNTNLVSEAGMIRSFWGVSYKPMDYLPFNGDGDISRDGNPGFIEKDYGF